MYFVMLQTDRHWHDFCEVLGIEHLEHEPRFATHNDRDENAQELVQIIEDIFATKTKEEWKKRLAGKNLIYSWVQSYSEVINDPRLQRIITLWKLTIQPQVGSRWQAFLFRSKGCRQG